jgi:hypothetical protein
MESREPTGKVTQRLRPRQATSFHVAPDLQTQWEDLLNEIWRQEQFERTHPYTCGAIRAAHFDRRDLAS